MCEKSARILTGMHVLTHRQMHVHACMRATDSVLCRALVWEIWVMKVLMPLCERTNATQYAGEHVHVQMMAGTCISSNSCAQMCVRLYSVCVCVCVVHI